MRQRGMGYAGAIIAMVIAGLIVYTIIFYGPDILRRIEESREVKGGVLSVTAVREHPHTYLGENVTVEGYYYDSSYGTLVAVLVSTDGFLAEVSPFESNQTPNSRY